MEVTAKMVKELREKTGVGMMDCKNALVANNGNIEESIKYLRERGINGVVNVEKTTIEGCIYSYIHSNGKMGVLLEINCETDFVARTDEFQELCKNIAMQIAATSPISISDKDIDQSLLDNEKEIYYNKAINDGKPEKIANKIVEGQIRKYISQHCLLNQPYIKDPNITVSDVLTNAICKLKENIQIIRFTRYTLGK